MSEALEAVATQQAPQAIGPYSQAVKAGRTVFLSGQIALDPKTGRLVAGGVKEQAQRCLENLRAVLAEAGADFSSVVKTTVYMTDLSRFGELNDVYGGFFKAPYPARATVEVKALPKGALVEIDAIAAL